MGENPATRNSIMLLSCYAPTNDDNDMLMTDSVFNGIMWVTIQNQFAGSVNILSAGV
jgi:hypothetical protein